MPPPPSGELPARASRKPARERIDYRYDTLVGTRDPLAPVRAPRQVRQATAVLAGLLSFTFATVGWLTYSAVDERLRLGMQEQLQAILGANVRGARVWLEDRETMTRQVAALQPLASATKSWVREPQDGTPLPQDEFERRLLPLKHAGIIADYFVLDGRNRVRASSAPSSLGLDLSEHPLVVDLAGRQSAIQGPVHPISKPGAEGPFERQVLSAARLDGQPSTTLLLAFDSEPWVQQFSEGSWGETGEVYAFDDKGTLLTESRFTREVVEAGLLPRGTEETSLRLRLVDPGPHKDGTEQRFDPSAERGAQALTHMAARATRGQSGSSVEGYRNYLGREVVGAWTWLDEYDLGIATEVSVSDAFASTLVVRKAALLMAALMLIATLGFAFLGQWTLRLRRQSLVVSERLDRLARAIQPLSAALETDPTAVLLVNDRLEVVYANPAAGALLDAQLEGTHVSVVFASLSPALREALIDGQDTVVAQGEDGAGDTLLVSTRELTIDGRLHALYMLRPVTQELRRQEVEHWKKLIRVLSHELNNSLAPITSLVSSARKLAEGTEREAQLDKVFATISERTRHLLDFLESYRSVARLPRPARRDVDWEHFIDGIRAQMRFELDGDLPVRPGYFDPTQMERVLLNLLKNAHEAGGPPEDVHLRVADEEDGTRIDVLDRGTGMTRTVLEQATLPFYSTKRTGTGVGLALSREIVEAHRGRLTLANREGGGLAASVWLPQRTEHRLTTTL